MNRPNRLSNTNGFSLIELLIVIAVIMLIAAIAIGGFQRMMTDMSLRATATNINGLIHQARIQAVKDNKAYTLKTVAAAGANGVVLYVDLNNSGALDAGEPSIQLPKNIAVSDGTGGPAVLPAGVAIPPFIVANTVTMSFNSRGLPCSDPPVCNTISPFMIYLKQTRPSGAFGWGSLTVTRAGRIKAYTYTGSAWN